VPGNRDELQQAAAALLPQAGDLADEVMARVRDRLPAWMQAPELIDASRQLTRDSIAAELEILTADGTPPASCPDVDSAGARVGAQAGVPLDVLLRGYRTGHAVQWEALFERAETTIADAEHRRAVLRDASRFLFEYADRLSGFVTEEYTAERDRLLRTREQRRTLLVRELLEGGDAPPSADDLDYAIAGRFHLAAIVTGDAAPDLLAQLASESDRALLSVAVVEGTVWAWLGGRRPVDPRELARRLEQAGVPEDTRVAFGTDEAEVDGFRASHRRARAAGRVAADRGMSTTVHDDVALEILMSADEAEAAAFAARELRGIDGEDARSRILRATLRSYFAHGQNAAATASALGVHEQTVAARLRAAEERRGAPVGSRRAELEIALRIAGVQ
jgi:hypothetical protein